MSELRRYRGGRPRVAISLASFIQVLRDLGLNPQLHEKPVTLLSYQGRPQETRLTWDSTCLGGYTRSMMAGIDFELDGNGNVRNWQFLLDQWGVGMESRRKQLQRAINRAINATARTVAITLNAGVTAEDARQLLGHFGASRVETPTAQERIACGAKRASEIFRLSNATTTVTVPSGVDWLPEVRREVPTVARVEKTSDGLVRVHVPEAAIREFPVVRQGLLNLKRAANAVAETTAQLSQSQDRTGVPKVTVTNGLITAHEIEWTPAPKPEVEIQPESAADLQTRTALDPNARTQVVSSIAMQIRYKKAILF